MKSWKQRTAAVTSVMIVLLFAGCMKNTPKNLALNIQVPTSALNRINKLAAGASVDEYFFNITGDGLTPITKTVPASEIGSPVTFLVTAGSNRVVSVMAFVNYNGTDFVTTGNFGFLQGSSNPFTLTDAQSLSLTITLDSTTITNRTAYPFIAKFVNTSGSPIVDGTLAYRRSSDGFLMGNIGTTDNGGEIHTRFIQFPWPVDVLMNSTVMASGLDFKQSSLSGNFYLINTQPTVVTGGGSNLQIAVGLFSGGSSGLGSYTSSGFATSIANQQDPFTSGTIPDLSSHLSSNTNLSSLISSSGTLVPAFSSSVSSYTLTLPSSGSSINVTPTAAVPGSTITVNGSAVKSGTASTSSTVNVGTNTISIVVKALNGSTQTYTIIVNRKAAVSATTDAHTTISPSGTQDITVGSSLSYTVTAATGYVTSGSVGGTCPVGSWTGSTYTTGAITANCSVAFSSATNYYSVTTSIGNNLTVSPNTAQSISYGSTTSFTVTPATGYTASVSGSCGGSLVGTTYTTAAITANCTETFSATLNSYSVTPSGDSNETFSPSSSQTVNYGATQGFTVTANANYTLRTNAGGVTGTCPSGTWSGSTYTTGTITSACTVNFVADDSKELNPSWTPQWSSVVAYWKLNEMNGSSTVSDYFGNGNNGNVSSGVTLGVTGKLHKAASFDGSATGSILVPWPFSPDLTSPVFGGTVTYCAWIYPANLGSEQGIMGVGNSGNGGLNLALLNSNTVAFWYAGGSLISGTYSFANSTWFHVCGSAISLSNINIYVNGAWVGGGSTTNTTQVGTNNFVIANEGQNASNRMFQGLIDDAAIWNVGLSGSEIFTIYDRQVSGE